MHFQTIEPKTGGYHHTGKTPFSILTSGNEASRDAATDVKAISKQSIPFTPWYAKVKPQALKLDADARKELGMEQSPVFQPAIANNAESWKELITFGLKTGLLREYEVVNLLECSQGSMAQIDAAKALGSSILGKYSNQVIHQEKVVKDHLKGFGLKNAINPDFEDWYKQQCDGTWGFEITLDDGNIYGEGCNELDVDFSGLGIRIESASRVTTLSYDLDIFSTELAKIYLAVITRISQSLSKKMTTFDLILGGDVEDLSQSFIDYKISKEDAQRISDSTDENLEEILKQAAPEWFEKLTEHELYEVKDAANYALMTTYNPWHSDTLPYSDESSEVFFQSILEDVKRLDKGADSSTDANGIKVLEVVVQTVLKLAKFDDADLTPWRNGSDTPICHYAYTSFGFDADQYALEFENEHRQSVGEYGALRLDLACENNGFETINNILLGDYCLMALATVN